MFGKSLEIPGTGLSENLQSNGDGRSPPSEMLDTSVYVYVIEGYTDIYLRSLARYHLNY